MDPVPAGEPAPDLGEAIEDVSASTRAYIREHHAFQLISVSFVCMLFSAVTGYFCYLIYVTNQNTDDLRLLFVPIFPLSIPFMMYAFYRDRVRRLFVRQIAQAIGFTYTASADTSTVSGTFFTLGHSPYLTDVMSGTYKDRPVRIYAYQYTTGSGKNQQTHTYTVFEMNYGAPLPHILMNVPELFAPGDVEYVELEGNFDKDFKLYVSKGQQMEIREIFQPDVMQELISSFTSFSMEVFGTTVYVMRTGTLTNKQKFLDMVAMIDKLFDDILPGLASVARVTSAGQT